MHVVKDIPPPTGLSRLAYRVPIHAYHLGIGWIFGNRLLLLKHLGRRTGKMRESVLEVVERDRASNSFVVASGWGTSSAWYRNVLQTPEVSIQVGTQRMDVTAVPLLPEEGGEIFASYAARHKRLATWLLPRVLGFSVDGSRADFLAVGRQLPFVRFMPRT